MKIIFYIEHPNPKEKAEGKVLCVINNYQDDSDREIIFTRIQEVGLFAQDAPTWYPATRIVRAEIWTGSSDPDEFLKQEVSNG